MCSRRLQQTTFSDAFFFLGDLRVKQLSSIIFTIRYIFEKEQCRPRSAAFWSESTLIYINMNHFLAASFLAVTCNEHGGFMVFVVLCLGEPEGSTVSGSQKMGLTA